MPKPRKRRVSEFADGKLLVVSILIIQIATLDRCSLQRNTCVGMLFMGQVL